MEIFIGGMMLAVVLAVWAAAALYSYGAATHRVDHHGR
jgi:hypothetical protein